MSVTLTVKLTTLPIRLQPLSDVGMEPGGQSATMLSWYYCACILWLHLWHTVAQEGRVHDYTKVT